MTAVINFVGDVALFRKFEEACVDPFNKIKLPKADYTIGNFEFVQPMDGRKKAFYNIEDRYKCSYPYFRSLRLDKFDAFSLANNHAMDYGKAGLEDVISVFDQKKIAWFGVSKKSEDKLLKFSLGGIKFVVIGGVNNGRWSKDIFGYGPESADIDRIKTLIEENKSRCDHIIVFLHWGSELVDIPPPENVTQSKMMINLGASAVIGHHPHVSQGIQRYKKGIIAFSLGSFIYLSDEEPSCNPDFMEQNVSIVLNIQFSRENVQVVTPQYYLYNPNTLIPEMIGDNKVINQYISKINNNIENVDEYTSKIRKILMRREIKLFMRRFRKKPFSTIIHYFKYLEFRHFKKILGM